MRIVLQPAFILHHRPYRETSMLLDVLTRDYGRVGLLARGIRQANSKLRSLLQPFYPLLLSWSGRGELMTLNAVEANALPFSLSGDYLLSGFYVNELLVKLLHKQDPHPELYTIYAATLLNLQQGESLEKTLRIFEKKLLESLGYGLLLREERDTGQSIEAHNTYFFHPENGLRLYSKSDENQSAMALFSGKSLLAFAKEHWEDEESLRDAKRLIRLALTPLLNGPLHSRKMFQEVELNE